MNVIKHVKENWNVKTGSRKRTRGPRIQIALLLHMEEKRKKSDSLWLCDDEISKSSRQKGRRNRSDICWFVLVTNVRPFISFTNIFPSEMIWPLHKRDGDVMCVYRSGTGEWIQKLYTFHMRSRFPRRRARASNSSVNTIALNFKRWQEPLETRRSVIYRGHLMYILVFLLYRDNI